MEYGRWIVECPALSKGTGWSGDYLKNNFIKDKKMKSVYFRFRRTGSPLLRRVNGRRMLLFIVSMFICISFIGCSCDKVPTSTPYFPTQRDPGAVQMLARGEGRLILDEGYLRFKMTFGESYMIIWPYGYTIRLEGKTIQVLNADGRVVARAGDRIVIGGGETNSTEGIENSIGQPLPLDCTGPYWIAGEIIE